MILDRMRGAVASLAFTALIGTAPLTALAKEPSLIEPGETPELRKPLSTLYHQKGLSDYENGDHTTAYQKIKAAAELGNLHAQNDLAVLYRYGNGTSQNYQKAAKWFREAAAKGNAESQYGLGRLYALGLGVLQDYNKAVELYKKSAEQDYTFAQFQLGTHYFMGLGVTKDPIQAHMWLNLAASSGHERAAETRDKLAQTLTRHQISEARTLAKDWVENHRN